MDASFALGAGGRVIDVMDMVMDTPCCMLG